MLNLSHIYKYNKINSCNMVSCDYAWIRGKSGENPAQPPLPYLMKVISRDTCHVTGLLAIYYEFAEHFWVKEKCNHSYDAF